MSVPRNRYATFASLAGFGLLIDLLSKEVIFKQLGYPDEHTNWLLETSLVQFRLYTSFNEGALWGMGQGLAWLFASLSVVAFTGVIYWLFMRGAAESLWLTITLGLITAGTLGNLYDRLALHGNIPPGRTEPIQAVRDFLHFRFGTFDWPIFNFADVFLVIGAGMLVLQSFQAEAEASTSASSRVVA